jgi:hypothetical protein
MALAALPTRAAFAASGAARPALPPRGAAPAAAVHSHRHHLAAVGGRGRVAPRRPPPRGERLVAHEHSATSSPMASFDPDASLALLNWRAAQRWRRCLPQRRIIAHPVSLLRSTQPSPR